MKSKKDNFIGIFDSGMGGISVLNYCLKLMPNENYVYYADSANFPYGKKSREELINIGNDIISKFVKNNAKELIIACNTMSTCLLGYNNLKYDDIKVVGTFPTFFHLLTPGLTTKEDNFSFDKYNGLKIRRQRKKLLIIATTSTCNSDFVKNLVRQFKNIIDIYVEPTDFIVKAVENDRLNSFEFKSELSEFFKEYKDIDFLILGCTHFPFALKQIREILGDKVTISSGGEIAANNCFDDLKNKKKLVENEKPFIEVIDYNLNEDRMELFKKLANATAKQYDIIFNKDF